MYKLLTSEQRYTISVLPQKKMSLSFIAETIGVIVGTVSREIRRNSNSKGVYGGHLAVLRTRRRRAYLPGSRSLDPHRSIVFMLIRTKQWSPEQVPGRLRRDGVPVSKSSIYNWIAAYSPHRKYDIRRHLRHGGHRARHPRNARSGLPPRNRISIDDRPGDGYARTVGDWEMDTIVGREGKGTMATLMDGKSGYPLMDKLDEGKQAEPLARTVVSLIKASGLRTRTITTDNGTEFAAHG